MDLKCNNTFQHYQSILELGKKKGYMFKTCNEYYLDNQRNGLLCILRHDVDFYPERSFEFAKIEYSLGIKASYFFRIHSNEYNCLSYETVSLIKDLYKMGHEIGLHAEPIDINKATGFNSDASILLGKHLLEEIIEGRIYGVASHNDPTPDNNLKYFENDNYRKYGFHYEAYDKHLNLFNQSYYITDSHPWFWRTYINGSLSDEHKCLCRYINELKEPLYCLIHPHMWYHVHFHRTRF